MRTTYISLSEASSLAMKIFGLSLPTTEADFTKAYRATARRLHPDTNKGDLQATNKFQEMQESYNKIKGCYGVFIVASETDSIHSKFKDAVDKTKKDAERKAKINKEAHPGYTAPPYTDYGDAYDDEYDNGYMEFTDSEGKEWIYSDAIIDRLQEDFDVAHQRIQTLAVKYKEALDTVRKIENETKLAVAELRKCEDVLTAAEDNFRNKAYETFSKKKNNS